MMIIKLENDEPLDFWSTPLGYGFIWGVPETGIPPKHPLLDGIFHCKPSGYGGTLFMETPYTPIKSYEHQDFCGDERPFRSSSGPAH